MTKKSVLGAWAGAALAAATMSPAAHAAPREEVLRADLVRALTEVCLPAQAQGVTAKRYLRGKKRELGLRPVQFSNRARSDAWSLSNDRRAYVFSGEEQCYASAEVASVGGTTLVSDLHADLSAFSVVEPATAGEPDGAQFVAGYCTELSDGTLASYNLRAGTTSMEAGTGRKAPGRRVVLFVSAPKASECGR